MMAFLADGYEPAGVWVEFAEFDLGVFAGSSGVSLVGEDRGKLVGDLVEEGRERGRRRVRVGAHGRFGDSTSVVPFGASMWEGRNESVEGSTAMTSLFST